MDIVVRGDDRPGKQLDRTLVVIAGKFSRDTMIEGVPGSQARDQATFKVDKLTESRLYGLHRQFRGGPSVQMLGGGMKRGFLFGATVPGRATGPCLWTSHGATVAMALQWLPPASCRRISSLTSMREGSVFSLQAPSTFSSAGRPPS